MLNIGALSQATGCNVETIRYYEKVGLIPLPLRSSGGHRLYDSSQQMRLLFIRKARELGFSLAEIRELLGLSDRPAYSCSEALTLVQRHLQSVNEKLARLETIRSTLLTMANACQNGCSNEKAPDCPIIETLEGRQAK